MKRPALMLMGTGSDVGKSTLVAGLCRAFTRRGLKVMPFKPQNMSNNAAVTADGGEIGRAQALQALAARVPASIHMNPVLLKPESETGAQVIVQGTRLGSLKAMDYAARKAALLPAVMESFRLLEQQADLVLVEGAGSASEVNLRAGDIANMGFAEAADVPVVLVGDIDRGGVIAALVGTHALVSAAETARVKGFIINKFRGDARLFDGGLAIICAKTGWRSFGVLPFLPQAARLPAEDVMGLAAPRATGGRLTIAVPRLSRIANFDDFDPLLQESDIALTFVEPGSPLPVCDLVILPGSKATIADLAFLRAQGWDIDLAAHVRRGGRVLGLCGGYQMLGKTIADPDGVEGPPQRVAGLGLLDLDTVMAGEKVTRIAQGVFVPSGAAVSGYEIHMGRTQGPDAARPLLNLEERSDGAISADGRVMGCYLHGLFVADGFRRSFLASLGARSSLNYAEEVEAALEALADHVETHLDVAALLATAQMRANSATSAP